MNEIVSDWLDASRECEYSYETLMQSYRKPYAIICYLAGLSAEMKAKACYLSFFPGQKIPKTHDIVEILGLLPSEIEIPPEVLDGAKKLKVYAVSKKYPTGETIDSVEANLVICMAKRVGSWAEKCIQTLSP